MKSIRFIFAFTCLFLANIAFAQTRNPEIAVYQNSNDVIKIIGKTAADEKLKIIVTDTHGDIISSEYINANQLVRKNMNFIASDTQSYAIGIYKNNQLVITKEVKDGRLMNTSDDTSQLAGL